MAQLIKVFDARVQRTNKVYIVMHALDESTKQGNHREKLLEWILEITKANRTRPPNVWVIATSRRDQPDM